VDSKRLLKFCDAVELIVTNICFKRQKNKLVTYVSGSIVTTRCQKLFRLVHN